MKVVAIEKGYYGLLRRFIGDEFHLMDKKDFSKKWMQEVGKADVKAKPAKESKKLFGKKDAGSEDVI